MMNLRQCSGIVSAMALVFSGSAFAQQNDVPDTPGTGQYPALKEIDPGLPDQVVYRPADLAAIETAGLGIYAFGNGGCSDDAASSRLHLLEVASHGYLVIAPGGIYSGPGSTERPDQADVDPVTDQPTRPEQLTAAIDWALAENERADSPYFGLIDPDAIAVSGFSCGGIQALVVAADPRIDTAVIMNSGLFVEDPTEMAGMVVNKSLLNDLHYPTLYVLGGPTDIAYENGMDDFAQINHVPVAVANIDRGHGGTYSDPNGGAAARLVVDWLDWQLRSDQIAGSRFAGPDCGLCNDSEWSYQTSGFEQLELQAARSRCEAMTALAAPGYRIDTVEWSDAAAATPAHCLFQATLGARPSNIDGVSLGTGFEVRLPFDWNGRFLFQGGGGLNGVLSPAIGNVRDAPSALGRGFAVVSSDGGHRGRSAIDSSFAADQQAKLDFAYQAVARVSTEAKQLVDHYYGQEPDYSYFMGCSTGGREAMLAAQRLPLEFDGIVAGNPSFNLTRIAANQVYSLQTVSRIAPLDENGQPQLHEAFTDAQLANVASGVLASCDALDGLADGMINDFAACDFTPATLACSLEQSADCLTAPQVTALNDLFAGARDSQGQQLYGAFTFDTGIASSAWRSMYLGSDGRVPANATLGADTLRLFAMTPPAPDLDPLQFDFDNDMASTAETAAINDAVATMHTSFAGNGGKMIVYHGLSDQGMSAGAMLDWYEDLTPRTASGPQDWARLFLVPGMLHCGGGQATDSFDMLSAIQGWVEEGKAPDRVIATGSAFPGVSRPLCPYPEVARFDGGNQDDADSFTCR